MAWLGMQIESDQLFFPLHQAVDQNRGTQEDDHAKQADDGSSNTVQRPGAGVGPALVGTAP